MSVLFMVLAIIATSIGAGLFHPGLGLIVFGAWCVIASAIAR